MCLVHVLEKRAVVVVGRRAMRARERGIPAEVGVCLLEASVDEGFVHEMELTIGVDRELVRMRLLERCFLNPRFPGTGTL